MNDLRARRRGFAMFVALAMLVRLLVPAGFMPEVRHGHVTMIECPGVMPVHGHGHDSLAHDGFERPCAFAAVATTVALLAIVVLLAPACATMVRRAPPLRGPPSSRNSLRWRPPLRAPPMIPLAR